MAKLVQTKCCLCESVFWQNARNEALSCPACEREAKWYHDLSVRWEGNEHHIWLYEGHEALARVRAYEGFVKMTGGVEA